jgi:hypothetical protein
MPAQRPAPAYPGHDLGRRLCNAGTFRFQTRQLFMSATLLPEDIAWEDTAEGLWSISCDDLLLARLDARAFKLDACKASSLFPVYSVSAVPGCYMQLPSRRSNEDGSTASIGKSAARLPNLPRLARRLLELHGFALASLDQC